MADSGLPKKSTISQLIADINSRKQKPAEKGDGLVSSEGGAVPVVKSGVDNKDQDLKLEIDLNVLNHLGINLYSNTPAVLTEIVANAWDADAKMVNIEVDSKKDLIRISDDGLGMTVSDLQNKFLTVGYARRDDNNEKTPSGRQCMGRKGIGKLAMFSMAEKITVVTKTASGDVHGLIFYVSKLKESIKQKKEYIPIRMHDFSAYQDLNSGTVITLEKIRKNVSKTASFLRRRLARRFSVIGDRYKFKVKIDGAEIGVQDRDFYNDIQFLWTFGDLDSASSLVKQCAKLNSSYVRHFSGDLPSGMKVNGFIGSVFKPEQLKKDNDNNNTLTLIANGRIFEEDIKKRIDDSKVFNSYLVGELQVDELDDNHSDDIAVSSRQGVQEDDPRYVEFLAFIKTRLGDISKDWDEWRREVGSEAISEEFPKLQVWLDGLNAKHKKMAKQLINKTNVIRFSGTEEAQRSQKREILKAQVLAFEKLRFQENLDAISTIDVENNVSEFRELMITVEDLESSLHRDIIEQRLAVIKKLDSDQESKVLEAVVQEHIYKDLWLLDTQWEYKENPTDFELRLSKYLKDACPDSSEGARLDIGYRTTAGRYVIIELKRPGLNVDLIKLLDQGEKYVIAMSEYFTQNPNSSPIPGKIPPIDLIFVIDKCPTIHEIHDRRMTAINARLVTYKDLVRQSRMAYQDHLDASTRVNRIREILEDF